MRAGFTVLFALFAAVACEKKGADKEALTTMSNAAAKEAFEEIRRLHQEGEADFRKEPVKFSFWLRGGDPGEGYTSDMLELELRPDRSVAGAYTKARFDLHYEPPYLAELFSAPVPEADAAAVLRLVFGSALFTAEYPSERKPPIGDLVKETWTLSRGKANAEKTFFHEFPADLADLRAASHRIMQDLEKRGERQVLNRKRK